MDSGTRTPDPDLIAHERTYHGVNVLLRWSMLLLAAGGTFLTLWLATATGFLGGAVAGLLVFIVGYLGLIRPEGRKPLDPWTPHR